jgi:hypothetical protein
MTAKKPRYEIQMGVVGGGSCLVSLVTVATMSVVAVGIAYVLGGFGG